MSYPLTRRYPAAVFEMTPDGLRRIEPRVETEQPVAAPQLQSSEIASANALMEQAVRTKQAAARAKREREQAAVINTRLTKAAKKEPDDSRMAARWFR